MANYTLNYTGEKVDELLNKIDTAFGETTVMGDTLTWDGDMTGRDKVVLPMDDGEAYFVHVSDAIPSLEELQNGGSIVVNQGGELMTTPHTSETWIDMGGAFSDNDMLMPVIVLEDNFDLGGIVFPKKGIYLMWMNADGMVIYYSSFTINNYTSFEREGVIKLPPKYIPTEGEVVFTIDGELPSGLGATRVATCNKSIAELFGAYRSELINCSIKNNHEFLNGDEVTQETTREFKPYNVTIANNIESGYKSISLGFADNSGTSVSHYAIGVNTNSNEIIVIRAV